MANEEFVNVETEEKARFLYWQKFKKKFETMPMMEFMEFVKCENEGSFHNHYGNKKSFEKMRDFSNLDFAHTGMRVNVAGKWSTIVGNWKTNLFVLLDGEIEPYNCHPFLEIAYYDDEGNVVRDYQKG